MCITGAVGNDVIANGNLQTATCSGPSTVGQDPVQVMLIDNPANAAGNSSQETLNIVVGLVSGDDTRTHQSRGRRRRRRQPDHAVRHQQRNAAGPSWCGRALPRLARRFSLNTPSCGVTPPVLEPFSSAGGDPILFDVNGARLATPITRQKPDFVGPDGGNNTFLGFTLASAGIADKSSIAGCQNNAGFPNFFGTSAATPHVASIAALLLQADPALTPTEIYTVLQQSAKPIGASPTPTAPNFAAGYGFVQADVAAANIPAIIPAAPALSLAATSIAVNTSTTITWSSANTTGCTASGSWSGPLPSNGTQALMPTATGTNTYTLVCANVAGTSAPTSVTLMVTAAAPPAAPSLSLGATSIVVNTSTTIAWSSANTSGCTASGSWSGALPSNGTQTLTPTAVGTDTYTLVCANAAGTSAPTSVTLSVTAAAPPASGSHGGGSLGLTTLLGLAGLCVARMRRSPRFRAALEHHR